MAVLLLSTVSTQILNIRPVFADDSTEYTWYQAPAINPPPPDYDSDYGWTLPCPSIASNCTSFEYVKNGVTYGEGDTWGYGFRNCTSYLAWKMYQMFKADIHGWGHAKDWATNAPSSMVHSASGYTPVVGDIAQWNSHTGDADGHVAYVYNIEQNGTVDLWEYNQAYDGNYSVRTTAQDGTPNNYIHVGTVFNPTPSTPSAVARDSSDMAVFYNDGNSHLANYSWNSSTGWAYQQWTDSGGLIGQPAVDSRTTNSMDVFYTTGQNKLVNMGWTASGGWTGPTALLSSGVAGDPAVVARDSSHMQVFYRDTSGNIKSIAWDSTNGWNLNPQQLYTGAATTDPTTISRSSDNMEVFFGKNNGHLVHLGWSSGSGWNTDDWSAGAGVTGKPSAITRNSGADMSAYYQENGNGKVAEEHWNWQTGWGWQDWTASLAGSPSAVPGVTNVIDDFYRETGGNVVDRYFGSNGWQTTNVVGSGSATGNPNAIVRDTSNEEVFYWNSISLMDANWNTGRGTWSVSQVN